MATFNIPVKVWTDTKSNLDGTNPIVPTGLLVFESDTGKVKIGTNTDYQTTPYWGTDIASMSPLFRLSGTNYQLRFNSSDAVLELLDNTLTRVWSVGIADSIMDHLLAISSPATPATNTVRTWHDAANGDWFAKHNDGLATVLGRRNPRTLMTIDDPMEDLAYPMYTWNWYKRNVSNFTMSLAHGVGTFTLKLDATSKWSQTLTAGTTGSASPAAFDVASGDPLADTTKLLTVTCTDTHHTDAATGTMRGTYDAAANVASDGKDLEGSPAGMTDNDGYTVTTPGLFYTIQVYPGDILRCDGTTPTVEGDWDVYPKARGFKMIMLSKDLKE